jgi:hypothetical protein
MRATRASWLLALCAILLAVGPTVAFAGGAASTRDLVLDFQRSGVLKDLLGKTLGVAKSFLFLATFLAFALEAFGKAPGAERDYGAVTWRLVVILFLLWNYQAVFGGVLGILDRLEREVAPESTWSAFVQQATEMRESLDALADEGEPANGETRTSGRSTLTTWAYEALIACVQLLAEGLVFLINWLSRVLAATLFILGPLALVAAIPRVSSTGTRWFQRFVTVASWPIFSGVLLSVLVTLAAQGGARQSYLECLVAALVMLVTALATPLLASQVIGGAMQNLASAGFGSAKSTHRELAVPVYRAIAGVASLGSSRVVHAASHAAQGALGGSSGGGSSGGGGASTGGGGQGGAVSNAPGGSGARRGARRPRGSAGGSGAAASLPPSPPPPSAMQGGVVANPPAPPPSSDASDGRKGGSDPKGT